MCARNVRELTSCASAMNVWLRLAATGLRYTDGEPLPSNVPRPTPSGCVSLNATRLVGASSSQNVACTSFGPPLIPNSRHMARDSMCNRGLRRRGALRRLLDSCARGDCVRTRGAARPGPPAASVDRPGLSVGWRRGRTAGRLRDRAASAVYSARFAITVYLATRALLLVVAFVNGSVRHHSFTHELSNWDGLWYRMLADHGYPTHVSHVQTTLGFFPVYPAADVGGVARVRGPGRPLRDPVVRRSPA